MTSATQGIKTVLHPVSDPGTANGVRSAARRRAAGRRGVLRRLRRCRQHIGLVPAAAAQGDLAGGLLARRGHRGEAGRGDRCRCDSEAAAHDVGGGHLVATVAGADGNVLGLQDR